MFFDFMIFYEELFILYIKDVRKIQLNNKMFVFVIYVVMNVVCIVEKNIQFVYVVLNYYFFCDLYEI